MNVLAKLAIFPEIPDAPIIETTLPNLSCVAQFSFSAKGEAALNQLHGFLDRIRGSEYEVNMVRHDYELMQQIFSLISITEQNFQQ